jgi:hypothetical protein
LIFLHHEIHEKLNTQLQHALIRNRQLLEQKGLQPLRKRLLAALRLKNPPESTNLASLISAILPEPAVDVRLHRIQQQARITSTCTWMCCMPHALAHRATFGSTAKCPTPTAALSHSDGSGKKTPQARMTRAMMSEGSGGSADTFEWSPKGPNSHFHSLSAQT